MFALDDTKLCLITPDGAEYARRLSSMGINVELALGRDLLLYTGLGTNKSDIDRAADALCRLDKEDIPEIPLVLPPTSLPRRGRLNADNALDKSVFSSAESVLRSVGGVSSCYVWAYPPGIPAICPGERLDKAHAEWIASGMNCASHVN